LAQQTTVGTTRIDGEDFETLNVEIVDQVPLRQQRSHQTNEYYLQQSRTFGSSTGWYFHEGCPTNSPAMVNSHWQTARLAGTALFDAKIEPWNYLCEIKPRS
jgi:hypothetical protein